jgi:hypothetical protein
MHTYWSGNSLPTTCIANIFACKYIHYIFSLGNAFSIQHVVAVPFIMPLLWAANEQCHAFHPSFNDNTCRYIPVNVSTVKFRSHNRKTSESNQCKKEHGRSTQGPSDRCYCRLSAFLGTAVVSCAVVLVWTAVFFVVLKNWEQHAVIDPAVEWQTESHLFGNWNGAAAASTRSSSIPQN